MISRYRPPKRPFLCSTCFVFASLIKLEGEGPEGSLAAHTHFLSLS